MNRHVTATLIGAFVLAGISLFIAAIIIFGGAQFFKDETYLVCYFDGSINGLQVGSPVKFRGAKVGEVIDIRVEVHHKRGEVSLPVIFKLQKDRVYEFEDGTTQDAYQLLRVLIRRGLRAQLSLVSIVTGQLYIELDFHPDSPVLIKNISKQYMEMPTIPSTTAELSNLATSARNAFEGINNFVHSPKLNQAMNNFSGAMKNVDKTVGNIKVHVNPISVKLVRFMDDFSDTLRSIRVLANYLARHPEALIAGKPERRRRR